MCNFIKDESVRDLLSSKCFTLKSNILVVAPPSLEKNPILTDDARPVIKDISKNSTLKILDNTIFIMTRIIRQKNE